MQPSEIKVAFVGAGLMAREHLRAFQNLPGVSLVGLHSRTQAKAVGLAQEFGLPTVATSIKALHQQTQADLVVVAVPILASRAVAEECLSMPWTVLMEKPPGLNLAEAEQLLAAARTARRPAYVALNRRFLSSTQAALMDLAARDEEHRYIHIADQQSVATAARFGHPPEVLRNWMYANSIHVIDLLRAFGRGPITQVQRIAPFNPDQPGVVLTHVRFESGDTGLYEGIWNGPGPWGISVSTRSCRWELRPLEKAACQTQLERQPHMQPVDERDERFKPGLRRQAEEIIAALRGCPSQAVSLEQSLETMRLVDAIFQP